MEKLTRKNEEFREPKLLIVQLIDTEPDKFGSVHECKPQSCGELIVRYDRGRSTIGKSTDEHIYVDYLGTMQLEFKPNDDYELAYFFEPAACEFKFKIKYGGDPLADINALRDSKPKLSVDTSGKSVNDVMIAQAKEADGTEHDVLGKLVVVVCKFIPPPPPPPEITLPEIFEKPVSSSVKGYIL